MNITSKSQAINASNSALKDTECMPVSQTTHTCSLCMYVSPCNRAESLHKHYHQSSFSEENEHSMSLWLGLYHSLATNGHWAKLQKKKVIFILEASQNTDMWLWLALFLLSRVCSHRESCATAERLTTLPEAVSPHTRVLCQILYLHHVIEKQLDASRGWIPGPDSFISAT